MQGAQYNADIAGLTQLRINYQFPSFSCTLHLSYIPSSCKTSSRDGGSANLTSIAQLTSGFMLQTYSMSEYFLENFEEIGS